MSTGGLDARIQACLDRLRAGDDAARAELIGQAGERLRRLARAMLRDYPGVRRWEQTDDVLQNALVRLQRALAVVRPESVRGFFGLAATQLRRELIEFARHYQGPQGLGAHHATAGTGRDGHEHPRHERATDTDEPTRLAEWGDFHRHAGGLPEPEREVFDLLWYHGLTQAEAARVLGLSERTVKRYWRSARLQLQKHLQAPPE